MYKYLPVYNTCSAAGHRLLILVSKSTKAEDGQLECIQVSPSRLSAGAAHFQESQLEMPGESVIDGAMNIKAIRAARENINQR